MENVLAAFTQNHGHTPSSAPMGVELPDESRGSLTPELAPGFILLILTLLICKI